MRVCDTGIHTFFIETIKIHGPLSLLASATIKECLTMLLKVTSDQINTRKTIENVVESKFEKGKQAIPSLINPS